MKRYEDMLHMPYPVSSKRPGMSQQDRAAQFAPFAALVGFDGQIAETGRLTDAPVYLTESAQEEVDRVLQQIRRRLAEHPRVEVEFFRPDPYKPGGAWIRWQGRVGKIDLYRGVLLLDGEREVVLSDILTIIFLENMEKL